MSRHPTHTECSAAPGALCAGEAWLDAGVVTGLVVADSNRPAVSAGCAGGLLKRLIATH
jgi:hypothetical protein